MSQSVSMSYVAPRRSEVNRGNAFRRRRLAEFLKIVDEVVAERGSCRVIDLGGETQYWEELRDLWTDRPISILSVNLAPQYSSDDRLDCIEGDACHLPQFADSTFDVVHSNSVIEHVGGWENKRRMANEIRRLAPRFFVQTPNFWFPMEPHFRTVAIHWLPHPVRRAMVMSKARGCFHRASSIDEAHWMLSDSSLLDIAEMRQLFPEATIQREKMLGLTKSLIAVSRSAAGSQR